LKLLNSLLRGQLDGHKMKDWPPILAITYLLYCIFWLGLTIGGCGYIVFVLDYSGAWFVLAILLGGSIYKPYRWYELYSGINSEPEEKK